MNVDTLFASLFAVATVASFVLLTVMTANLPLIQDRHQMLNSIISGRAILIFFVLMFIPAVYFSLKGLNLTAGATMIMAGIAAMCMTRLSNRARIIARQRHYA